MENIFTNLPSNLNEEIFEDLLNNPNFKIERIISTGQSSPDGFWYEQEQNEWVILLSGSAELEFENEANVLLYPGDYLLIPAMKRHRVLSTSKDDISIWLAVHYK